MIVFAGSMAWAASLAGKAFSSADAEAAIKMKSAVEAIKRWIMMSPC
jgi:hypothetical protein